MANLVFDFLHAYETGERRESEPASAYQYDEGHVLEAVLPEAVTSCEIHYWIRGQEKSEAYTPGSITQNDDGSCTVIGNIPNLYFETNGELRVYIVVTDGDASITTYEGFVHICQRSMPDDYVDDDPENEATRVLTEAQEAAATATAAAQTAQDVADSIPEDYSQLSEDVDTLKEELTYDEYLINNGTYTIKASDLESGQWSYSTKASNTARARTKNLLPVRAGMTITYANTTFDTYFGVLETPTSPAYIQTIGWKTDGNGTISITKDGWLTFIIRNHADTTANVNPADYDSTVIIITETYNKTNEQLSNIIYQLKGLNKIDGSKILEFESGGMYEATGIEYADGTRSRTDFIPVEAGSTLHIWFDITGVTSVAVFEFASNTTTSQGINERLALQSVNSNESLRLTSSTNYIRVQVNVATSSITNPVIIQNGGWTLGFKGTLPSCDLDTVNTNTGIWQLITANSYANIPQLCDSGWLEVIKTNTWILQRFICGKANGILLRRSLDSGSSWSTWINISEGFNGVLPSCDLNTVNTNTGIWQLITANSYANIPQLCDSGWLEVIKTNTWILQRFICGKANGILLRRSLDSGSSWSTWINISKDINLLYTYAAHESWTHRGVTFTWNSDNTVCTAVGTNDGTGPSVSRFYANQYGMPSWIEPGKTYYFTYESTGVAPSFFIELFSNGTSIFQKAYRKNDAIRIPLNTTGITLRLNVVPSETVDGTVSVRFDEMMTNLELSKELYDSKTFGIDFLRTYGNRTNSSSHGVSYTSVASVPRKYHIAGTVSSSESADSTYSVYFGAIPAGIEDGDKLIVQLQTEPAGTAGLGMVVTFYDEYMSVIDRVYEYNLRMDLPLTIPKDSKYMRMTLFVIKGNTVDVTTEVKLVKLRPQKMDVPLIISIVDDDISNDTYVTKFHDACLHNNIVGNYAVITKNITDGNTTLEKLLDYEDEGFGMLIHCWKQVYPSGTSPWVPQQRTKAQTDECRANLAKGLRDMREMGFVNYNHWITPGGRIEADLQAMGRQFGLLSMASIGNGRHNTMQDLNRYYIKRLSLHPIDDTTAGSVAGIKDYIDKCVADNLGGWLIITTHFNEWGNLTWDTTLDANGYPIGYSRFNEVIQYALSKGLVPMSYQEAWAYYQSILESNREVVDKANS